MPIARVMASVIQIFVHTAPPRVAMELIWPVKATIPGEEPMAAN